MDFDSQLKEVLTDGLKQHSTLAKESRTKKMGRGGWQKAIGQSLNR